MPKEREKGKRKLEANNAQSCYLYSVVYHISLILHTIYGKYRVRGKRDESGIVQIYGCAACRSGVQFSLQEELIRSAAAPKAGCHLQLETEPEFFPRKGRRDPVWTRTEVQVKKRISSTGKN